ncbi:PKD domain-containing protein [Candidatus Microgenomates bacterium]|nr:MAG: PKD domain-containing protein [Candidatus Microgenomates bacterium]
MNRNRKNVIRITAFLAAVGMLLVPKIYAQNSSSDFSKCQDGRSIVRCETYDCPNGDTNNDGKCSLSDNGARLTDARNDSFCANPISGCGQVQYYATSQAESCSTRVEENNNNCNLYSASTPTFTPKPSATPDPGNKSAVCERLEIDPASGNAPLTVELAATVTGATVFEFDFGDSEVKKTQSSPKVSHTYDKPGTYVAQVSVKGSGDTNVVTSTNCKKTVIVRAGLGGVASAEDENKTLPKTGSSLWIGFGIVLAGGIGVYLFERYRVI